MKCMTLAQFNGFFRIVWYLKLDEHIGPSHDTQANFTVTQGHSGNFRQWIAIDLNHIIQKVHGQMNSYVSGDPSQSFRL